MAFGRHALRLICSNSGHFAQMMRKTANNNFFDEWDELSILMKGTISLLMNVTSVSMNQNFDEWVYDHLNNHKNSANSSIHHETEHFKLDFLSLPYQLHT